MIIDGWTKEILRMLGIGTVFVVGYFIKRAQLRMMTPKDDTRARRM